MGIWLADGPVDPLVGRADELQRVKTVLAQSRLVTLTGPGGSSCPSMRAEMESALHCIVARRSIPAA